MPTRAVAPKGRNLLEFIPEGIARDIAEFIGIGGPPDPSDLIAPIGAIKLKPFIKSEQATRLLKEMLEDRAGGLFADSTAINRTLENLPEHVFEGEKVLTPSGLGSREKILRNSVIDNHSIRRLNQLIDIVEPGDQELFDTMKDILEDLYNGQTKPF